MEEARACAGGTEEQQEDQEINKEHKSKFWLKCCFLVHLSVKPLLKFNSAIRSSKINQTCMKKKTHFLFQSI